MRERIDTFQVGPVATKPEIKILIREKLPEMLVEARKTANGRTITARATLREFDTLDGLSPAFIAHLFIEHRGDTLSGTDLVKETSRITEQWKIGVYSSPNLENP